jgi:hypothetical protein
VTIPPIILTNFGAKILESWEANFRFLGRKKMRSDFAFLQHAKMCFLNRIFSLKNLSKVRGYLSPRAEIHQNFVSLMVSP